METVCGFMVVRRPACNFEPESGGSYSKVPPQVDGIYYGGIDRMPWFDVDEAINNGSLPGSLREIHDTGVGKDFTGMVLLRDPEDVRKLLEFSNRLEDRNEMVAVYSEILASLRGTVRVEPSTVEWLGYDVAPLGEFSLLYEGLFVAPSVFEEFRGELNSFGLFESTFVAERYIAKYRLLAEQEVVEPFGDEPYEVEPIRVGRARMT